MRGRGMAAWCDGVRVWRGGCGALSAPLPLLLVVACVVLLGCFRGGDGNVDHIGDDDDADENDQFCANPSGAVLLSDDFDDGDHDGWTIDVGDWWVGNDGHLYGEGWGGSIDAWLYTDETFGGSLALEADLFFVDGNAQLILNSTGHWENEYRFEFWMEGADSYENSFHIIKYQAGNEIQHTDGNEPSPVAITNPSRVVVLRQDAAVAVCINGVLVKAVVDDDPIPATGRVGVGVVWDWTGALDNVTVYSLDE